MSERHLRYRNIAVRGVVYADANAAAQALGVTAHSVRAAIREGRLQRLGQKGKPVEVNGERFESLAAAGRAYGVTAETVALAIKRGTTHRLGTGRVGWEPCPVRIRGKVYPSAADAAVALGVSRAAVYAAIGRGAEDKLGLGRPPCMIKARPVVIGGMAFESMAAASRAIGRSDGYVAQVLRSGSVAARNRLAEQFVELGMRRAASETNRRVRHA